MDPWRGAGPLFKPEADTTIKQLVRVLQELREQIEGLRKDIDKHFD